MPTPSPSQDGQGGAQGGERQLREDYVLLDAVVGPTPLRPPEESHRPTACSHKPRTRARMQVGPGASAPGPTCCLVPSYSTDRFSWPR
jgi:hypothetical protein